MHHIVHWGKIYSWIIILTLRPGARLTIGDLELEISQNCTLCKSLAKIDARLPKLLKDDRGVFAKVISSGTIRKGDNIYLLK